MAEYERQPFFKFKKKIQKVSPKNPQNTLNFFHSLEENEFYDYFN